MLVTAQLFTGEELLLLTGIAGLLLVAVLAAGRPRAVPRRSARPRPGSGSRPAVTLLLAGYALWVQFFGPLTQHGSSFTPDFFKNDLTGFVTPSRATCCSTRPPAPRPPPGTRAGRRSTSPTWAGRCWRVLAVGPAGLLAAARPSAPPA